jgi:hypothetical protein
VRKALLYFVNPQQRILGSYDVRVSFEEYIYDMEISRSLGALIKIEPYPLESFAQQALRRGPIEPETGVVTSPTVLNEKDDKTTIADVQTGDIYAMISQEEWDQASRACRTAKWSAVFHLATTSMMGPYSVP